MPEPSDLVQREYQRSLSALHEARAGLDGIKAARRRLVFDRSSLGAEAADRADADLRVDQDRLQGEIDRLRQDAERLRQQLRAGHSQVEPDEIEVAPPVEGFEQPPFSREL